VLEKIPSALARKVAEQVAIPIIGIGAGPHVDGQVLVTHDLLGITKEFKPRFLRRYADLNAVITQAVGSYIQDVKNRDFPNEQEAY
jgi:3-methyl-2-oxobutanoate hydroxymethyltransferase